MTILHSKCLIFKLRWLFWNVFNGQSFGKVKSAVQISWLIHWFHCIFWSSGQILAIEMSFWGNFSWPIQLWWFQSVRGHFEVVFHGQSNCKVTIHNSWHGKSHIHNIWTSWQFSKLQGSFWDSFQGQSYARVLLLKSDTNSSNSYFFSITFVSKSRRKSDQNGKN